jgi:hypothetical protein
MANNLYTQQFLPRDAQTVLIQVATQIGEAYDQEPESWAVQIAGPGVIDTMMPEVLFPFPLDAAEFKPLEGDMRYRRLLNESATIKMRPWSDGVEEVASKIEDPRFLGWDQVGDNIGRAARHAPNEWVKTLLSTAESTACQYDGEYFFDTDHPYNPADPGLGTYSNLYTGGSALPLSHASIKTVRKEFRTIKKPNGKEGAGLKLTHILVPANLEETALEIRNRMLFVSSNAAIDNDLRGSFEVIVGDNLPDSEWYGLALNRRQRPWGIVRKNAGRPEMLISDKSSHLYIRGGKRVSVGATMDGEAGLLLPQCIKKCKAS